MSENKKKDIRITKTDSAIFKSLTVLLEAHSFLSITILDICKQACISRATFYAHFDDKYHLLQQWLVYMKSKIPTVGVPYAQLEVDINTYVWQNRKIIRNIIKDANYETLDLVSDWLTYDVLLFKKNKSNMSNVISATFCAGGMIKYLTWQVSNKFPTDLPMMNRHIRRIVESLSSGNSSEFDC